MIEISIALLLVSKRAVRGSSRCVSNSNGTQFCGSRNSNLHSVVPTYSNARYYGYSLAIFVLSVSIILMHLRERDSRDICLFNLWYNRDEHTLHWSFDVNRLFRQSMPAHA